MRGNYRRLVGRLRHPLPWEGGKIVSWKLRGPLKCELREADFYARPCNHRSSTKEQRRRPPPMDLFGNVRALMMIDCPTLHSLIVTLMRGLLQHISKLGSRLLWEFFIIPCRVNKINHAIAN